MIVKGDEFDRNFNQITKSTIAFLFHGTDLGLIHERAKRTAQTGAHEGTVFQLVRLHGDQIAVDPGLLADEAGTISLFGDRRVIWIEAGAKNFSDSIAYQLKHPPENCSIIIEAGNLKPSSPLRKLLDSARHAASIGCYADSVEALKRLVQSTLASQNLTIDDETRDLLVARLGNDRLITRSELEKLCQYARGESQITWKHISDIMNDASAIALEEAIDAAFMGQRKRVEENSTRVFQTGGDPNYVLMSALTHALKLHRIRLDLDQGGHMDALLSRNGLFYQRKQIVTAYMPRWNKDSLLIVVKTLQDCISRSRQNPKLSQILCVRTLWTIAGLVGPTRT